jgi:hypothetical protein
MTRQKKVATLSGKGKVSQDDKFLFETTYRLTVKRDMVTAASFRDSKELEGNDDITGSITATEAQNHDLLGESLTLELKDGRLLNFAFSNNSGGIQVSGGFYTR